MIGTGSGKQYETEFDYLIDTQWTPTEGPSKPSGSVTGAISEEGRYPSSGALSSDTLTDADDPIKAWSKMAMMKKETFIGGRRVGEGGGGLSKPANDNSQPLPKGPEGKDYRLNDNRPSHGIPQGLSADQINKLKEIRGEVLGPTAQPNLSVAPAQASKGIKGYRIWDNVEKKYVSDMYTKTPTNSKRANTRAEKMNLEYGAHRYSKQIIWEDE